jgi:hypothetical protein
MNETEHLNDVMIYVNVQKCIWQHYKNKCSMEKKNHWFLPHSCRLEKIYQKKYFRLYEVAKGL